MTLSYLLKRFVAAAELKAVDRHRHWTSSVSPELLGRLGIEHDTSDAPPVDGRVLDVLQRASLRRQLEVLAGYDTTNTGALLS